MTERNTTWQDGWLNVYCEGQPLRKWFTKLAKKPGFALCRVCNLTVKFSKVGVGALKQHGKTRKHLDNCKAAGRSPAPNTKPVKVKVSPVPSSATNKGQKRLSNALEIDSPKSCNSQHLHTKLTSPIESRYHKNHIHQTIDPGLGPLPYYHISANESRNSLIPVYPCCFCPEEFLSKQLLRDHQVSCIMKPPALQAVTPSDSDSFQSISEDDVPPPISPPMNGIVQKFTKCPDPSFRNQLIQQSKREFIAGLGLLPERKARQISQKRRNTECENIDWEEEIPITPTTPSSNRTPKSLISHLSRDGSEHFRRRLSFCVDGKTDKEKDSFGDSNTLQDEESEDKADEQERKVTVRRSLFNLDVTSPLGQFVIKHFKGDPSLHILSDIESHCLTTPAPSNSSISRLRVRNVTFPITFRGYSVKSSSYHVHKYKFSKEQVREFMRTVNTGLDRSSRHIRRQMKPCRVMLKHVTKADLRYWIPSQNLLTVDLKPLTDSEIAFWTMPKDLTSNDEISLFPNGLKFTSPNLNSILGLRTRQNHTSGGLKASSLTVSNFVSEDICAELVQNRKVLYRSLLSDCSSQERRLSESDSVSFTRPGCFAVLRRILSQGPSYCDSNSINNFVPYSDPSKASTSKSSLSFHSDFKEVGNLETSLEDPEYISLQSRPRQKVQCQNSTLSVKKIVFSDSPSQGNDLQSLYLTSGIKVLGGFSVGTRTCTEGDEIKVLSPNHDLLSPRFKIEQKKGKQGKDVFKKENSSKYERVNGLKLQKKMTLRSPTKVPLSKTISADMRKSGQYRKQTFQAQQNPSEFKSKRVENRKVQSIARNGLKKCQKNENVSEQLKTRHQNSKSCLSKFGRNKFIYMGNRSEKARSSSEDRKSTAILSQMQPSWAQQNTSDCLSARMESTPIVKNTKEECERRENVSGQMKTRHQNSKTCHVISHKTNSKLRRNKLKYMGNSLEKVRSSSKDEKSIAALNRKLRAAGLERRDSASDSSVAPALDKEPKTAVPHANKISNTKTSLQPDNSMPNRQPKESLLCDKYDSHNLVLRRSKSDISACNHKTQFDQHRSKSRICNERHKRFMLWLRSLRKGNIA